MGDTPKPYVVTWDDWNDQWIATDGENIVEIPYNSNHDVQAEHWQVALDKIMDRIAEDWL